MATYNNINELFKDICDKLREKLGTTDLIKHNEIAEKIESIETGGGSNYEINSDYVGLCYRLSDKTTINNKIKTFNNLDKSNILIDADSFFYYVPLTSLTTLNNTKFIKTSNMFYGCDSLTSLDVSNFDMSECVMANSMFYQCNQLESLDVSSFDTSKILTMQYMFYYCSNLTSLNISNFVTKNCNDMSYMFCACQNLKELDLSNFDTRNVLDMQYMFNNCTKLATLKLGNNFKTNKCTSMAYMFFNDYALKSLDLSNFNYENCYSVNYMLAGCKNLSNLELGANFNPINSNINLFNTNNYQNVELKMTGNKNFSNLDGSSTLNLTSIWRGTDTTKKTLFETFAKSLGTYTGSNTRTIKIYSNLYNSLTSTQKALITNKGYLLSYGTS